MDKEYPPQESAPPYPGVALSYGSTVPQPGFHPAAAPPVGYQGVYFLKSSLSHHYNTIIIISRK